MNMNKKTELGKKLLLVEDEDALAMGLEYNLSEEGYTVKRAANGKDALEYLQSDQFDLVILDIMIPYIDGFTIAEKIRADDQQLPILMLTARTGIEDRVRGLESGADDYLPKPFHLEELLLRLQGMLKRKAWYISSSSTHPVVRFGRNEINFQNYTADNGKHTLTLTSREAMIMKYFVEHQNRIITRKELLEEVWHIDAEIDTRTVDNFIARLRKYFEPNPNKPVYIKSIRSAGYMFNTQG
jgi:two-component system alkaline phosphatase synthesis response regulator PhoP